MWLTLDFVSKRYGKLPSEVLSTGSSIDIRVAEVAIGYETYLNKKEENPNTMPRHTVEELQAINARIKEKGNEHNSKPESVHKSR